ncbi:carbohydrate ABC transporter permease [Nesterenkonia sp. F]|uniref:carbohydrate ABC transporter permease n=1 Tax=Nesterenkonia sp. F TaxID=795955 RepID=UPI000255D32B|nr:carbohydrate ABC transporter permease [Nesterenkonia sp. F]
MTTATSVADVTDIKRQAKPGERRFGPARIAAFSVLLLMALTWLFPFFWAVVTSFKTEPDAASGRISLIGEGGISMQAYEKVLSEGNIYIWAWNSLWTSLVITVITVAISALAAYAFSRLHFRGRTTLFFAVIASIIVPPQVLIIPLYYEMLAFNLVDTPWGLILPQIVMAPIVLILKKFFDAVPIELEDAARVDGAGRLRVFLSVVLPLSRPILGAVSIFVFIQAWNNFLWPFIVLNDTLLMTLPVGLQTVMSAYGVEYAQVMAQAVLAALPLILVFLFFQRQIVQGVATTGFGGQ